jgi:hypothetical protein
MAKLGLASMAAPLEHPLDARFYYGRSLVSTIDFKTFKRVFPEYSKDRNTDSKYLLIQSLFELDNYDSVSQGGPKTRPEHLGIHGIIAFLTATPITSFDFSKISYTTIQETPDPSKRIKPKLLTDEEDHTDDLKILLGLTDSVETEKKSIILSLLDRWRKGLVLQHDSDDSFMYEDEALLAYYHVWEMLAKHYAPKLQSTINHKIENLLDDIFTNVVQKPAGNVQDKEMLNHQLQSVISSKINIKDQILFMLKELHVHGPSVNRLVKRFTDYRNRIAHGNSFLYEDKANFPLRPFFTLIKDGAEELSSLQIATAATISYWLGLKAWTNLFGAMIAVQPPGPEDVKKFIYKEYFNQLSPEEFIDANVFNIDPMTIIMYYFEGKLKFKELEKSLSGFIKNVKTDEKYAVTLAYVSIVLADSENQETATASANIIKEIDQQSLLNNKFLRIRDILKELEYRKLPHAWIKSYLNNK